MLNLAFIVPDAHLEAGRDAVKYFPSKLRATLLCGSSRNAASSVWRISFGLAGSFNSASRARSTRAEEAKDCWISGSHADGVFVKYRKTSSRRRTNSE